MENRDNKTKTPNIIPPITAATAGSSRAALRAQESAKRTAAKQQRMLFILLAIAVAINLLLGYFLYGIMVTETQQRNQERIIDHATDAQVKIAEHFIKTNVDKLNELTKHTAIIQAINDKDANALPVLSSSFSEKFYDFLELKILIAGETDLTSEGIVPIRFAELDLIRRTEKREEITPEAILINDKWQIHFTAPIPLDKTQPVKGSLFLTLHADQLKQQLSSLDTNTGESVLQQKFPNSPTQAIHTTGTKSTNTAKEKSIAGSHWLIKFTPSNLLLQQGEEAPTLWMLSIAMSTALSLLAALILSRVIIKFYKEPQHQPLANASDVSKATINAIAGETIPNPLFQHQDILDVAVIDEDENILGLNDTSNKKAAVIVSQEEDDSISTTIFRSYDIRGVVGEDLTPELAEKIGQAIGSEALDQGEPQLIVARDARTHSEELTHSLIKGILSSGCNVINIGIVPTPVMYFATYHFEDVRSGVMVTASHNPAEYNGFKVVINNNALADEAVMHLRTRILTRQLHSGIGEQSHREIIPHYIDRIFSDVALATNISVVVDAGNAVTGIVAPQLFEELGCDVIPLYCDLDGTFPNHDPDPTQEKNLRALISKVRESNADIGVAFDGDGDRLVVVTPKGDIIWPDRLLMLFAKDVLSRNPGADVLFDVKCSRLLNQLISSYGGRPIMWKTGHSPMKAKMVETGALIGGEYSGHIFIKDRWYGFDDGLYAMARLLEIITLRDQKIDDIFASFPQLVVTPEIKVAVPDKTKFDFIKKLAAQADFQGGDIIDIDGLRVDYSKGWGLVRASNTSPALTLRFEADSEEALAIIQKIFKRELLKIDSKLTLNF